MTPLDIEILLHCHTTPIPIPNAEFTSQIESIAYLLGSGLIEPRKDMEQYKTTEKGDAHVAQLCALELPKRAWIDANDKIIEV